MSCGEQRDIMSARWDILPGKHSTTPTFMSDRLRDEVLGSGFAQPFSVLKR
jgi:hypothetical protein